MNIRYSEGDSALSIPKTLKPLSTLKKGESAIIEKLEGRPEIMLHLIELGLSPGERVTILEIAPWGGPLEVELMDYRLAIRKSEAEHILTRCENGEAHGS
jgi:Fe2+ transport system protein FeoA